MRRSAFALPLVLVLLITLASLASFLFRQQSTVIQHIIQNKEAEQASQIRELINISYPEYANPFSKVEKQFIELDGLFNVNHLVETTALEKRMVNDTELLKFRNLLRVCELPDYYGPRIVEFLIDDRIPAANFSTLDLLATIDAKQSDIPRALICFRIVSPLRKVNLRFVSQEHAPSLLGVSKALSNKILRSVADGQISTKDQFIAALKLSDANYNSRKVYQNIIVSPNSYHAATFWTYAGETFAYIEKKFDVGLGWKHLSNKILWLPSLEK